MRRARSSQAPTPGRLGVARDAFCPPYLLLVVFVLTTVGCSSSSGSSAAVHDSGSNATIDDISCQVPLSVACGPLDAAPAMGDCPPPVVGDLPGAWCAVNPGVGGLRACGTYDGLVYYTLPGSSVIALYDTDGGMLTALLAPENGELACVAGPAQLAIRASCRTAPDANVFAGFPGPGMGGCMRGLSDAGVVSD